MPFMKQGQPWLYDDATGDMIGIKDPDGGERFFDAQSYTADTLPDPATLAPGAAVVVEDANGNSALLTSSGGSFSSDYTPRKTKLAAWMPNILGYVDSSNTFTYALTKSAPCEFESVALILQNQHTSPVTVTAAVAVSESLATSKTVPKIGSVDYNALAAAGTQNGFIPVTYNNGVSPIVIPASTELFVTDQIPLSSIPRTDGGAFPLVLARVYANAQQTSTYQFSSAAEERIFGNSYQGQGGDFYQYAMPSTEAVATPSNWVQPATETSNMRIKGLVFFARGSVAANVLFIGDSIDHGLGGGGDAVTNNAGNTMQWSGLSCLDVSTKEKTIGFISAGWSGKTSANYFARGKTLAALFNPTVCVFPAYTPNDTVGLKSNVQAAVNRTVDFIEYCWKNNIVPVVRTPVPYSGSGAESLRIEVVNKVKSMGVLVIDANAPLYEASASAQGYWKSASYNVDGTHPSQSGHDLIREQAKQLWKLML